MKTGKEYAEQAKLSKYDKLTYEQYDCQAFCELILRDLGVRDPFGKVYNWKGSNDMARHAVSWVGTIAECKERFGSIPVGSWAFMWDTTGNEEKRGYHDGLGNYSHVGVYVGDDLVRDSTKIKNASGKVTRDGVGTRSIKSFQKIGLPSMLDFEQEYTIIKVEVDREELVKAHSLVTELNKMIEGWLKA